MKKVLIAVNVVDVDILDVVALEISQTSMLEEKQIALVKNVLLWILLAILMIMSKLKLSKEQEERFNDLFVREDGLLGIDKYSEDEIKNFIAGELQLQREKHIESIRKDRPIFLKDDIVSMVKWHLTEDEVLTTRKVLRIEILEDLGVDCSGLRSSLKERKNE